MQQFAFGADGAPMFGTPDDSSLPMAVPSGEYRG